MAIEHVEEHYLLTCDRCKQVSKNTKESLLPEWSNCNVHRYATTEKSIKPFYVLCPHCTEMVINLVCLSEEEFKNTWLL